MKDDDDDDNGEITITVFPMAKSTDPATSHIGALRHVASALSRRRRQVYDVTVKFPDETSNELGLRMTQTFPDLELRAASASPQKRLPELEKLGLVERGEPRKCRSSGYLAHTWRAVELEPDQADFFE